MAYEYGIAWIDAAGLRNKGQMKPDNGEYMSRLTVIILLIIAKAISNYYLECWS